jgi:hypothetical protein
MNELIIDQKYIKVDTNKIINQKSAFLTLKKMKFKGILPEIKLQPKLIKHSFDLLKYIDFKTPKFEKNIKYAISVEPDLGIKIDLINPLNFEQSKNFLSH